MHRRRHGRRRPVRGRAIARARQSDRPAGATRVFRASWKARIYREIEIDRDSSLADLAEAITDAFDFEFDHAYGFYSNLTGPYHLSRERYELFADMEETKTETEAKSVERTKLARPFAEVGKRMLFFFDYGDGWRFQVEFIGWGKEKPEAGAYRVVKSVGKAPPQYPDPDDDDY